MAAQDSSKRNGLIKKKRLADSYKEKCELNPVLHKCNNFRAE